MASAPTTRLLVEEMIKQHPEMRPVDIAVHLGISKQSVGNILSSLGLTKQRKKQVSGDHRVVEKPSEKPLGQKAEMKRLTRPRRSAAAITGQFVAQQVIAEVREEVKEEVQQQCLLTATELADKMFGKIQFVLDQITDTLKSGPTMLEPNAGWLRSCATVLEALVKNSLLLTGKPTNRTALEGEVKNINEQHYHIIQEIASNPDFDEFIRDRFRRGTETVLSGEGSE